MNNPNPTLPRGARPCLAVLLLFAAHLLASAQTANPPSATATAQTPVKPEGEVLQLSPFEVRADNNGYQAQSTMSGTRINSKLEDLAASITVVTKQQLVDTAALDLNDIFLNEGNTEGIYQYTEFTIDRGFTVDNVAQTPETANRIRGLGNANIANNGFRASSAIPLDTYNIDAVEISRGPNSNLFGVGEPSGTINVIRGRANLTRDITQFSMRVDDRGTVRASFDLNRSFWNNRVALRLAGLRDDTEFVRQPSFEKTRRYTAAMTFQPFEKTVLRANYEAYQHRSSRANSTTPRDYISEWRTNGSPVWDPTYNGIGGWRLLNGSAYTAVTPATEANLPLGLFSPGSGLWNRPNIWVNPDGSIGRYEVGRSANTAAVGVIPNPGTANANARYLQIGNLLQRNNARFPLYQQRGVTDQSIYDWEEVNFAAPNRLLKEADTYMIELEQTILRGSVHQLAAQIGYYHEDIINDSRQFIGASDGSPPVIQLDINERYLDGTPNPYFLRPYFGGSEMQTFKRPEQNEQARAIVAYQLDFTQIERNRGFWKWLGRHNFAGYLEFRENVFSPNGLRYRDQIVSAEPWHTATNLANIPGRGAGDRFYTRYYAGGSLDAGGSVIDYAPSMPTSVYGPQTLRYYNGPTALEEEVTLGQAYFAIGKQKTELRTRGLIWQGFLLDDRVIPTLGFRRDKIRSVNSPTLPLLASGYLDESALDNFPDTWVENSGPTKTKGIVVVPFRGWGPIDRRADSGNRVLDALRSTRLFYNKSDSFQPQGVAYNLFGEALPNTTSLSEEFGASISFWDGKVELRGRHYDQTIQNARNGTTAVIGTRPIRLDFDATGADSVLGDIEGGDNFIDLEDSAYRWFTQLNPGLTGPALADRIYSYIGISQAHVDSIKNRTLADINNVQSKGNEFELYLNPNPYWTLKGTFTEQVAIDATVSPNIQRYIDERLPIWTTLRVPTDLLPDGSQLPNAGRLWWEVGGGLTIIAPGAEVNNSPRSFYVGAVDAPYKLAVTQAGKPRPQTRKYSYNITTNYRLAGLNSDIKWLKNLSVGGTYRWSDKAIVGFYGATPDADGVIRQLDGTKPIYDKARDSVDAMVSYNFKMWDNRISGRLQLNVRNIFESGRLQAVSYNPDGQAWNFRIIDPRQFILSSTFDF